jgi:gamma-glutamylcyclotransferase (GGCT)/AIG2-like uncharacterized protein YtfP
VLERWTVGTAEADAVAGVLYDTTRGYPAATFAPDAATVVHGAVVELDPARADAALAALDRYEGREYARIVVRTAGGIAAQTYVWIAPLDSCVPIGSGRWQEL